MTQVTSNPRTNSGQSGAKKNSRLWMILALLFIISTVLLLILLLPQIRSYKELAKEKETQRTLLQYELEDLMAAHDSIKISYGMLADSLSIKDSVIRANADEIKQLLNYKWEYQKVNKKLELLRNITQGYVHQLDSLFTVNRDLKEENEKIRQQYASEQNRTRELSRDKEVLIEKMSQAAVLNTFNLTASTLRFTGSGRERETDRADRVERVQVCFTLGENPLVEPGIKTLYIRIIRPDGVVVTQKIGEDYTFDFNGALLEYSIKKEIEYRQKDTEVCMYWGKKSKEEAAMVGIYNVFLYTDTHEIGKTTFELR
jgi:hypothetical protein